MLISLKINNCFAFNKPVELSLKADMRTKRFANVNTISIADNINVVKSTVIYGPNNTGKTAILKCIKALKNTLLNIKTELRSNIFNENSTCEIGIVFEYKNKIYCYDYKYDDEKHQYVYEKFSEILIDNYGNEKEENIFLRDTIEDIYKLEGNEGQNFLSIFSTENLLMYTAETAKHDKLKEVKEILTNFAKSIEIVDMNEIPNQKTIEILKNHDILAPKIVEFIKTADLYLEDMFYTNKIENSEWFDGTESEDNLKLRSVYKGVTVPSINFDSVGTKKIVALASYIIETIENGKILFVDELDSSLHCNITRAIISLFNNGVNKNAQLICTIHDTSLLDIKRMFRKEQIWFTNKNEDKTELYSLKDFSYLNDGVRETTDIRELYNKGAFEAIPYPDLISVLLEGDTDSKEESDE